ncbi:MAG: gliding motility-associated C-terminal domain-containing protein [Crocinitomicaceae bacterium]|nr:gliding motility-associated C-terminal domain-containing protein [Crocinitomicaceae bacterium]NGF75202.1 T9SS type B sorting domain-containing protein [Fluviicola sp. SGL-29]
MKKTLLYLLLLSGNLLNAQNLVVNPSFEITNTNCSGFGGEGFRQDLNPSWDNANSNIPGDSCSSPDLFSACNPIATGMPDATAFGIGWQYSRTGTRHAGLIAYSAPFGFADNYREYIQGHTTAPLVAGQTYCVSFYISLADGSPWGVENIGVYFSNNQYLRNACTQGSRINVTPHLTNNCGILLDTVNWVRLQWDYVATGGEQYFIIGNFNADGATTRAAAGGSGFGNYFAYYFIDDVSIVQNTCCYAEIASSSACLSDAPFNLSATSGVGCSSTITGTWSGTGITNASSGTFSPAVAGVGTHTITFTATCGFVTTTTVTVSPCALQVCQESNGSLTASGGVNPYTWAYFQPGGTVQITNQAQCTACGYTWQPFLNQCMNGFMPATSCTTADSWVNFGTGSNVPAPSTYPIQVTDGSGATITINNASSLTACSTDPCATTTISIAMNPAHVTCSANGSATATPSGGATPYTYSWNTSPVQTTATATNLPAGNYTVTVTDNAGCTATQSVTINPAATGPTVTTASTPVGCAGNNGTATATVSGGTTPYTYSWNTIPVQTTATATNLPAGNYTVTVTDNAGCTATANVTVSNAASNPTVTTTSTIAGCAGANGTATATVSGGSAPYTYSWNSTPVQTTATATNLPAGNYTVTVTDNAGCIATANVTVNQSSNLTLAISGTDPLCAGGTGSATVTVSGGTPGYTYNWSPAGGTAATAGNLTAGSYTVTVTDNAGCSSQASIQINDPSATTLTMSSTQTQCTVNSGTATVTASGGTLPYTYNWSTTPSQTTATASNLGAGNYTVTVTDANGCQSTSSVIINAANAPTLTITNSQDVFCFGDTNGTATVTASGGTPGYTYYWFPSGETSATASNLEPGDYTVTVRDNAGCTAIEQVTIGEPDQLVATASVSDANCGEADGEVSLNVSGGNGNYTYSWDPVVSTGNVATGLPIGTYTVNIADALGCTTSVTATVLTLVSFNLDAAPAVSSIEPGDNVGLTLTIEPGVVATTISWTPPTGLSCTDCDNPVASPTVTTTYHVMVISDEGCVAVDSVTVIVTQPCGELFVPTIFSPNGDGLNDLECVMGSCVHSIDFTIYNRWGEAVFHSKDPSQCWDGTFRGKPVQTGVYVYKLEAMLVTGETVRESGNINVTR